MGKAKRQFQYVAYPKGGEWEATVIEDQRLKVTEATEEEALAEIRRLHQEMRQDDRYLENLAGQGGSACQQ